MLGTENRTENLLGYFTRFGDAASDIEPISDLYKTEVRSAARLLGLPEAVLTKHPTAGLWGGQTDEDELGFTYHDADLAFGRRRSRAGTTRRPPNSPAWTSTWSDVCASAPRAVAWKLVVPHALTV